MPGRHTFHHLPLRKLGFEHVPAVPVDIPGMVDTLVRLGVKTKQYEQALQGLSRTYTIRGTTARAYNFLYGNFLYGNETPDAKRAVARERLHGVLRRNPPEIHAGLAAEKLDERDDDELPRHDLTTVSLDDRAAPLRRRLRRDARAGHPPDLAVGAEHRALRQGVIP
jgi:hypothetical protein